MFWCKGEIFETFKIHLEKYVKAAAEKKYTFTDVLHKNTS